VPLLRGKGAVSSFAYLQLGHVLGVVLVLRAQIRVNVVAATRSCPLARCLQDLILLWVVTVVCSMPVAVCNGQACCTGRWDGFFEVRKSA
jgi:hypothetical protein